VFGLRGYEINCFKRHAKNVLLLLLDSKY
jgi:hypothetical protein